MAEPSWERVEALFHRTRDLEPERRVAVLDSEAADDPALREQVEALLAAHDTLEQGPPSAFLTALDADRAGVLLDQAGDPAEREAAGPAPDRLGRYEVVGTLGRGGMGVVYLGRDTDLDRPVAIKVLPTEVEADEAARDRLLAEARAGSALDHLNVGTVYEIGESRHGRYIAMAYYEGETLRERLARGPLPPAEAVEVLAQVADGLAAAHAAGIVHRDVKPENLMVTADGTVKILDFGIARGASVLATTGRPRGTVAYMSPEQTRTGEVDGRTDVWALGVVAYELLTGVRPFGADAPDAVLHAIRHDAPVPVRTRRAEVPEGLAVVVERCLEKDPEARFATAGEVAAALRGALEPGAGSAGPPRQGSRRNRVRAGMAAAAVVVAGGLAAVGVARGLGSDPAAASRSVVLADFQPQGADAHVARVVTEALRIDLLRSPAFRLVEAYEVEGALQRMQRDPGAGLAEDVAREIALRDGHAAVVAGDVAAVAGGFLLTARVLDASGGATVVALRENAPDSTALIAALDRLSKRVRDELGESVDQLGAARPLPDVATPSFPALSRYARAYEMGRSGGDQAQVVALLEEALELDPDFAAAHRSLAVSLWNMRGDRGRAAVAARTAYELRDRLGPVESRLAEAAYHWYVLGDPGETARAYRRVLDVDPHHSAALNNLGLALLFQDRAAEAEAVLRTGVASASSGRAASLLRQNLARALYLQGRTDAGMATLDSVIVELGGDASAELERARLLGAEGRWDAAEQEARQVVDRYAESPQIRAEATRLLWHLALTRGRLEEAERLFEEVERDLDAVGALDALGRAVVRRSEARLTLMHDTAGALAELDALLRRPGLDVFRSGATLAPRVAAALAAAGDTAGALRMVEAWEAQPLEARGDPEDYSPELARARVDLAGGRPEAAVRRLQRAAEGTVQAIDYLPDLAEAHRRAGRPDSAAVVLEAFLAYRHPRRVHRVSGDLGPALETLAELRAAAGDEAGAAEARRRLAALWAGADPALRERAGLEPTATEPPA
ncbi:MAG: protein kinase [Longimicrobiales bacterium]